MTYLENWQTIKKAVVELRNERPYFIFYYKEERVARSNRVVLGEVINDFNSMNMSWSKEIKDLKDLWGVMEGRNSLIFSSPESKLEYATFLSEPLVLNKFILVGVNTLDVDLEELETTLKEIRVYLK